MAAAIRGTSSGGFSASVRVGRMMETIVVQASSLRLSRVRRSTRSVSPEEAGWKPAPQLVHRQIRLHEWRFALGGDRAGLVGGDGDAGGVAELAAGQVE